MFLICSSISFIYISYTEIYILLFCATLQNNHNINLFRILGSWQRLHGIKEGKGKREKREKRGKGKIFFLNLFFLKSPRTSNRTKSRFYLRISQTWKNSQESAADHKRGGLCHISARMLLNFKK